MPGHPISPQVTEWRCRSCGALLGVSLAGYNVLASAALAAASLVAARHFGRVGLTP